MPLTPSPVLPCWLSAYNSVHVVFTNTILQSHPEGLCRGNAHVVRGSTLSEPAR